MTNKAATEATAQMRAAEEQDTQDSAAGVYSPAADKQPATPTFAGARSHQRAASSPEDSAAGGSPMDHGPEIEVLYSGESDSPSYSKPSAIRDRTVADTKTATSSGNIDADLHHEMFASSEESEISSLGSNRSRSYSYEASVEHEDVSPHDDVDDSLRSHRSHSRSYTLYCGDRGASSHAGTTQEEQDRSAIRSAPENKP